MRSASIRKEWGFITLNWSTEKEHVWISVISVLMFSAVRFRPRALGTRFHVTLSHLCESHSVEIHVRELYGYTFEPHPPNLIYWSSASNNSIYKWTVTLCTTDHEHKSVNLVGIMETWRHDNIYRGKTEKLKVKRHKAYSIIVWCIGSWISRTRNSNDGMFPYYKPCGLGQRYKKG